MLTTFYALVQAWLAVLKSKDIVKEHSGPPRCHGHLARRIVDFQVVPR